MTRLALTMRVIEETRYAETRDALSHDWEVWLAQQGYGFYPIPNCLPDPRAFLEALSVDGLVLTGGNDLIASDNQTSSTSEARTNTENALIRSAIEWSLPVFGTCRGLHVINAYFGGDLMADLSIVCGRPNPHVRNNHTVEFAPDWRGITNAACLETNSYHNQGLTADQLAPELELVAKSTADGVVEGVAHPVLPILAVQWHPERSNPASDIDSVLLEKLFLEGRFW